MLKRNTYQATLAVGQTDIGPIYCEGAVAGEIRIPASFTGTSLTFKTISVAGQTAIEKRDEISDAAYTMPVTANKAYRFPPEVLEGALAVTIVSGSAQSGSDVAVVVSLLQDQ